MLNPKGTEGTSGKQALPRGNLGLGYDQVATKAEIEAVSQIQSLKNQIRRTQEEELRQKVNSHGIDADDEKLRQVERKATPLDDRLELMQARKEKKKLKKQRQKERHNKPVPVAEPKDADAPSTVEEDFLKRQGRTTYRERVDEKGNKVIKKKSRSRQKNRRRDTRPVDVKRMKLAEKGIVI